MDCHGNGSDHCCWLQGKVCRYLEENTVPSRRWACGLYRELQDWQRVHVDRRYLQNIKPILTQIIGGTDCGDWPPRGQECATCG